MTKPSINRIIRDSRAQCLVLSQGEAQVMVDEIVRLRTALDRIAKQPIKQELEQSDDGDFEFAYDEMIRWAREAVAANS